MAEQEHDLQRAGEPHVEHLRLILATLTVAFLRDICIFHACRLLTHGENWRCHEHRERGQRDRFPLHPGRGPARRRGDGKALRGRRGRRDPLPRRARRDGVAGDPLRRRADRDGHDHGDGAAPALGLEPPHHLRPPGLRRRATRPGSRPSSSPSTSSEPGSPRAGGRRAPSAPRARSSRSSPATTTSPSVGPTEGGASATWTSSTTSPTSSDHQAPSDSRHSCRSQLSNVTPARPSPPPFRREL